MHFSAATSSFPCAFRHPSRAFATSKRAQPVKSKSAASIGRYLTILAQPCYFAFVTLTDDEVNGSVLLSGVGRVLSYIKL